MTHSKRISQEIKDAVLLDYYAGQKTVNQIVAEYGISRRSIYCWRDKNTKRLIIKRDICRGVRLSLDEAELVLLMIMECDGILRGKQRDTMRNLEEKMLMLSDQLTEIKIAKTL